MRDSTPLPPAPHGPPVPAVARGQPAGRRSGEGSDSVLEHMLKDTAQKADAETVPAQARRFPTGAHAPRSLGRR